MHLAFSVHGKHKEAVDSEVPQGLIGRQLAGGHQLGQALRQRGGKRRKLRQRPLRHLLQCLWTAFPVVADPKVSWPGMGH